MSDLSDPLAIAKAVGLYEDDPPKKPWGIPRTVTIETSMMVVGAYALITLGVWIGLLF